MTDDQLENHYRPLRPRHCQIMDRLAKRRPPFGTHGASGRHCDYQACQPLSTNAWFRRHRKPFFARYSRLPCSLYLRTNTSSSPGFRLLVIDDNTRSPRDWWASTRSINVSLLDQTSTARTSLASVKTEHLVKINRGTSRSRGRQSQTARSECMNPSEPRRQLRIVEGPCA